jgi:hypothetical protein
MIGEEILGASRLPHVMRLCSPPPRLMSAAASL